MFMNIKPEIALITHDVQTHVLAAEIAELRKENPDIVVIEDVNDLQKLKLKRDFEPKPFIIHEAPDLLPIGLPDNTCSPKQYGMNRKRKKRK